MVEAARVSSTNHEHINYSISDKVVDDLEYIDNLKEPFTAIPIELIAI